MNEPETLPALYRMTAEIHERLAKGEKMDLQGKQIPGDEWSKARQPIGWIFLRERPREKSAEEQAVIDAWESGKLVRTRAKSKDEEPGWHDMAPKGIAVVTLWDFERWEYRVPTAEELRVEANLRLKEEWERELFAVEFWNHSEFNPSKKWLLWPTSEPPWSAEHVEYRRKPEPEYVPWSYEDQICGQVFASKVGHVRKVVVWQDERGVFFHASEAPTYAVLLRDWLRLDGTPAGKPKE